jgi:hypothetical protein
MNKYSFSSIAYKTTLIHTVTYFVIGILSFLFFDYSLKYADPVVALTLRQTEHPLVTAGPLFQVLRGCLFGIAFYTLKDWLFPRQRGWLALWLILVIVGIISPFSAAPGSIEGVIYSTLPFWFHLMSLPELVIQSLLLAFLTHYWVNHFEKRWLSILMTILFVAIVLPVFLGVLYSLGYLSSPN